MTDRIRTREAPTMSDWESARRLRQERDGAFMTQLRAEHRHEMRVTLVGGLAGLVLSVVLTLAAMAVWGSTWAVNVTAGVIGIASVLGGVFLAHEIDDSLSATRWRVQGFLLPHVTGKDKDFPYPPIYVNSERQARKAYACLYRDHGPGMVRVEIERLGRMTAAEQNQ